MSGNKTLSVKEKNNENKQVLIKSDRRIRHYRRQNKEPEPEGGGLGTAR